MIKLFDCGMKQTSRRWFFGAMLLASGGAFAEEFTWSRDGSTLTVTVPAGFATGQGIRMFYDRYDKGGDLAKWGGSTNVTVSVPAEGGTYELDLAAMNIPTDSYVRFCRVKASDVDYELLTRVKQDTSDDAIDTRVKDTDCYGLKIGMGPSGISGSYPSLFGSGPTDGLTAKGLQLQSGGKLLSAGVYFSQNISGTYTFKLTAPSQNSCNDYTLQNNVFKFNGSQLNPEYGKSYWTSSPVGQSGNTFYVGCLPSATPSCAFFAWWYYLTFYGSDGQPLADYLPARRIGDNVLGLYDQVSGDFVTPINTSAVLTTDSDVTGRVNQAWITKTCQLDPPLAATPAEVSEENGVLKVVVHPKYAAGTTLYLAYGLAEGGDDLNNWANKYVICSSVPASGGEWNVTLEDVGVTPVMSYRVFAGGRFSILDRVQQNSSDDLVDTGIRDVDCIGLNVGVWISGYAGKYGTVFGTASADKERGMRLQLGGNAGVAHFGQDLTDIFPNGNYTFYTSGPKANQCNDYWFMNNTLKFRGGTASPGTGAMRWWTTPIARSEKHFCLGGFEGGSVSAYSWWYYVKLYGWDGQLLVDYVPVKRPDGTAGFFDRVTARFITPATGSLVAGPVTVEEAYVGVPFSESHLGAKPVTATWIGGTSPDLEDTANWDCRDENNERISKALPQRSLTAVTFTGALAFNVSPATVLWREAHFSDCTLAAACDWTGIDASSLADGTLDLDGQQLTVTAFDLNGTITDTSSGTPGILRWSLPENTTFDNRNTEVKGNLRVEKAGEGKLVWTKTGHNYAGGTDVQEGTWAAGADKNMGASSGEIRVAAGATIDFQTAKYFHDYTFLLDGGTLASQCNDKGKAVFSKVRLTDDSTIKTLDGKNFSIFTGNYEKFPIDLDGHTLTLDALSSWIYIENAEFRNGTIIATGSYPMSTSYAKKGWDARTCTVEFRAAMENYATTSVSNYIAAYNSNYLFGDKPMNVYGYFKVANANERFYGVTMQDGSSFDLREKTGAWSTTSVNNTVGLNTVTFADNATVMVNLQGREAEFRAVSPQLVKVVAWNMPPSNLSTLKFVLDPEMAKEHSIRVKNDGIYVFRPNGIVILIR